MASFSYTTQGITTCLADVSHCASLYTSELLHLQTTQIAPAMRPYLTLNLNHEGYEAPAVETILLNIVKQSRGADSKQSVVLLQAMLDAKKSIELDNKMIKAHYRLTQAQLHLGRFKAAVGSARAGERLLNIKASRATDFTMLLDQIAVASALQGDYAAFDGRVLQVGPGTLRAPCSTIGLMFFSWHGKVLSCYTNLCANYNVCLILSLPGVLWAAPALNQGSRSIGPPLHSK